MIILRNHFHFGVVGFSDCVRMLVTSVDNIILRVQDFVVLCFAVNEFTRDLNLRSDACRVDFLGAPRGSSSVRASGFRLFLSGRAAPPEFPIILFLSEIMWTLGPLHPDLPMSLSKHVGPTIRSMLIAKCARRSRSEQYPHHWWLPQPLIAGCSRCKM